jgi:Transposase IS66 family
LNRQSERYRRESIDLSLSTLADHVGACTAVLQPIHALSERHVLVAEWLHGDDTTVPILAKEKTIKGHIWAHVRDDRPFAGRAPLAAQHPARTSTVHLLPVSQRSRPPHQNRSSSKPRIGRLL